MAGSSLQIDDDYCKNLGNYFVREGKELETFISEYIDILDRINGNAIVSGEVAKALKSYIQYAKKLKGQISNISVTTQQQTTKFIASVDNADQYLF